MKREHIIRIFAGTFILAGLALGIWANEWFLLIPAFVGVNLVQSALTKWCLLEDILKALDIGEECK